MSDDTDWVYDYIAQYIKSPAFRTPIKDFIDDNCGTFYGADENTFQQGALHNEFKLLVENLLEKTLTEIGATQEMFILAAKKGLESKEDKKYFELLITFENYSYFKNMMTKRNLQLEELAYKLMQEKNATLDKDKKPIVDPEFQKMQKIREETEMECAIEMSLAIEDERRRLQAIEDEELKRAIIASQIKDPRKAEVDVAISLFDPTTLTSKNNPTGKQITSSQVNKQAQVQVQAQDSKTISASTKTPQPSSNNIGKTYVNSNMAITSQSTQVNKTTQAAKPNQAAMSQSTQINMAISGQSNQGTATTTVLSQPPTQKKVITNTSSLQFQGTTTHKEPLQTKPSEVGFNAALQKTNQDFAISSNQQNVKSNEIQKKSPEYVDKLIEKTEKVSFVPEKDSSSSLKETTYFSSDIQAGDPTSSIPQYTLKGSVAYEETIQPTVKKGSFVVSGSKAEANVIDVKTASEIKDISPNISVNQPKPGKQNLKTDILREKGQISGDVSASASESANVSVSVSVSGVSNAKDLNSEKGRVKKIEIKSSAQVKDTAIPETKIQTYEKESPVVIEPANINDNVNFNNLNFDAVPKKTPAVHISSSVKPMPMPMPSTNEDIVIDNTQYPAITTTQPPIKSSNNFMKGESTTGKLILGKVQDKKTYTGDKTFTLNYDNADYSNIKAKIDTTLKLEKKDDVVNQDDEDVELKRKYEQIQLEKQQKLKEYREMILKMKKEKRKDDKDKDKEDLFEESVTDSQLSEEVKRRLQMRKELASKLKNK